MMQSHQAALLTRNKSTWSSYRGIVLATALGWFVQKHLMPYLLPYGPADTSDLPRLHMPKVDPGNDSLRAKHGKLQKIFERIQPGQSPLMNGPETVFFDAKGVMYLTTADAKLVTLTNFETLDDGVTVMATATEVAYLDGGRPLAGAFHPADGSLYVTDLHYGLLRLQTKKSPGGGFGKVELVASRVLDQNGQWSRLHYVNDVTIGPKTGCVYFTDATDIAPDRVGVNGNWDGMYPAKLDLMRGKRVGRVLKYNPKTDQLSVVAQNLTFANGVAVVDADETNLIVAETMAPAVQRLDLTTGQLHPIVGLPGYPDGADCSFSSGLCYAALPSAIAPIHRFFNWLPNPIASLVRTLVMTLPRSLAPPVEEYGGIAEAKLCGSYRIPRRRILE